YIQNGVVERKLSDCRIVRVFVSNAKIESVEVCNPGNKQNNICPTQTEEEYKSCFQEVSKLPEDFNFLSTFSTIVQEGELVCDIPLCNDFEHVCEENIFLDDKNSVLGNNNIIQVFNPYDKIDYKLIFSANITENMSAVKSGEKRKVLISLYNGGGIGQESETTEQDITPIFSEIEFNASGNAILEGSFNPIVEGIFALNVRVLNQAEDCVARLDQIKIREEPILIVSIDQDEEIINAIETLTTTGNLNNLVTSKDTEYTVAFQEFLSAREACYRSDLFTGYNSPINFCYAYKEKFVNYLTKYAEYNLPPEYADQFILYLEDEEKLTDIANSFESNIRNNIISLFLELGIVEADIAKTITFTYKTELDEDVTGMGSGFFQKVLSFVSNPLKIFSALFNSANQEEFYEGLRTSDYKLDDMKTAFLILRASLYGNPLETIPIATEESTAGAAVQGQTHKNDWSRTYNIIRYSGEEGRASSSYSSIKQLFGINGEIDDDLILQELGFPVEIREKLLEEYEDKTRNINEVATNDLEALKNSITVYAPSVPLFKAINSENIPLITLGFSWLHYFTILESMGRWTAQQDKTYRGVFEKSAFETYDEIMGRYYGGAGAGPFMHNVIYEVKKQFLIELVGNQLQGILDTFGDEGAMYEKEVGLANKFFDSIERNIDAINAIQIADMIIGAIASFFMFQGISALVSKATSGSGTVVSKTSFLGKLGSGELGSFGKHIALLFKNNKLLSGLAKAGSAGLDNAVLVAVGALIGWELFSVFAGCISAYGNIPVDETRVHRLERQSKEPECWGRLGQFLVTIGGIGIERYSSSGWLRFGRENPALAKGITGGELLKNDLRSIKVLGKESIIQREKQVLNSMWRAERAGVSSVNLEARLAKTGKGGLVELFKKEPAIFQNIDNAIIKGQSLDDMIRNGIIGPDQIEIARAMLQQQGLGSLDVLGPESLQRFDRLTQKGDDLVKEIKQLGNDIDEIAFRNIAKKTKELTEEWNLFLLDYGSIEAKISKRAYAVEFELGSLKAKLPNSIKSSSDDIILDMIENRRAALESVYKDFPDMVQTSQQRVLAENFKNSLDESAQVVDDAVKAVKHPEPLPKPVVGKFIDDAGEIVGGGIGKNGIISGRLGKGRVAGITDAAGKSSGINQDVIIAGKKRMGVFDGVSSKVREGTGDQAAKIAGEIMIDSPESSFDNILNKIETNIQDSPGGATTASMGEVIDNELSYVTVGDSPIIVIRNGRAIQLSKPHSNAQSWLDEQLYSPGELVGPKNARPDKYATLTSALGSHDNSFTYYFNKFTLQENDIVL
ncbi:MAG: hypothetical protein AABW92_02415, partial [Nanoarchaeota archaeon]